MLHLIKYCSILFTVVVTAYSQEYPIPAEGSEWNNAEIQGATYYANRIACIGDTIIDSMQYSKLYQTWSTVYYQTGTCEFEYSSGPTPLNEYRGAIRTDEHHKVHYVFPEEDTSRLIYDFSANVGDSILIDGIDSKYFAHVIDVDTILLNEEHRKRITLKGMHGFPDEWIAGIGSTYGLFATFMRPWEKYDTELTCYQEFGIRLYPNITACDRCNIVTGQEVKSKNLCVSIYPNPVTQNCIISWPKEVNARTMNIYDLSGKILLTMNVRGIDNLLLNSKELTKGIFMVELIAEDGGSFKQRFLVL